jgi:hypothetical protein
LHILSTLKYPLSSKNRRLPMFLRRERKNQNNSQSNSSSQTRETERTRSLISPSPHYSEIIRLSENFKGLPPGEYLVSLKECRLEENTQSADNPHSKNIVLRLELSMTKLLPNGKRSQFPSLDSEL